MCMTILAPKSVQFGELCPERDFMSPPPVKYQFIAGSTYTEVRGSDAGDGVCVYEQWEPMSAEHSRTLMMLIWVGVITGCIGMLFALIISIVLCVRCLRKRPRRMVGVDSDVAKLAE